MSADAVVVGAGPNGLAAAITLARAGHGVLLLEGETTIGGGCRSAALTLPGFLHDPCSAIHPMGVSSPFFRSLQTSAIGLEWIHPPVSLAHPFDDGTAAILVNSVEETAASLGPDSDAYRSLLDPLVADFDLIADQLLGPLRVPRHPIAFARFGLLGLRSVDSLTRSRFQGDRARAFFAGIAAHAMIPPDKAATAAFGLVLSLFGHAIGWPFPRGGSQQITDALATVLQSLGGTIETDYPVHKLDEFADARAVLLDVSPRQLAAIAGDHFSSRYRAQLGRYRFGPGVFKMDWALSGPVPWTAPECHLAGTLHLVGSFDEIASAETEIHVDSHPERPFVLIAQPSLFDDSRAPAGQHTLWGYCHVPNGSTLDMTDRIEAQIERFAPGFRELILARATRNTAQLTQYNPNYIGGDINGGMQDLRQLFTRPTPRFIDPYATPDRRIYLCSSSTPPGGGVHGMSGYHAARSALKRGLK